MWFGGASGLFHLEGGLHVGGLKRKVRASGLFYLNTILDPPDHKEEGVPNSIYGTRNGTNGDLQASFRSSFSPGTFPHLLCGRARSFMAISKTPWSMGTPRALERTPTLEPNRWPQVSHTHLCAHTYLQVSGPAPKKKTTSRTGGVLDTSFF